MSSSVITQSLLKGQVGCLVKGRQDGEDILERGLDGCHADFNALFVV